MFGVALKPADEMFIAVGRVILHVIVVQDSSGV